MLYLMSDDNKPRPYQLVRKTPEGNVVLWATYLLRKSAIHQAKKEAERLKDSLTIHESVERRK